MKKMIVAAAIGNCVHVAGVLNFLKLAETHGYETKFLGPAVAIDYLLDAVEEAEPSLVAVSYRLTPETGYKVLTELKKKVNERDLSKFKYIFGGTLPVVKMAKKVGLFQAVFSGEESKAEIIAYLKGRTVNSKKIVYGETLLERIKFKKPLPLIRHHFGLPTVKATVEGIKEIAASKVLDIISVGPDQNAQEFFFKADKMNEGEKGAGGVPLRKKEDLEEIYQASRRGNYPLLRCYSGTNDVFLMAEMLLETINNAWTAVPLMWYNQLDGRGGRPLLTAIKENQKLMAWHAQRGIPVEVNEAHHWSLRDAHDSIAVLMAYLAAYNAKKMGVKTYIAQYMFNTPNGISPLMDLAKMLAKKELIESLVDENFQVLTQIRAGLTSFPSNLNKAKGQLAYASFLGMALKPEIIHVVAFCEAEHVALSSDIIESCQIVQQLIDNCLYGYPDLSCDPSLQKRKQELIADVKLLLKAFNNLGGKETIDPLTDPHTLKRAVKIGLLDAPHLKGNKIALGQLTTKIVNGACYAYDYNKNTIIKEKERLAKLGEI